MGISIRAQRIVAKLAAQRRAERQAREQDAQAAAQAYHAEFLDRHRAAEFLGISVHQLKRLVAAGKGPACVKRGTAKQATVRWPIAELRAYRDNPASYVAAKAKQEA